MDRIAGWNVQAQESDAIATAEKDAISGKQHIIYSLDISFSSVPSAGVRWEILAATASPATPLAAGYVKTERTIEFPAGLSVPVGSAISAVLAAAGSAVVGSINLHGVTR